MVDSLQECCKCRTASVFLWHAVGKLLSHTLQQYGFTPVYTYTISIPTSQSLNLISKKEIFIRHPMGKVKAGERYQQKRCENH